MPGIVGIISKSHREICELKLRQMIDCMMHEPFYTSGTYINEKLGVYAGWVGQVGSFSDPMPLYNQKKDVVLLFSGEDFKDKGLLERLRTEQHECYSSNASYLIHLYEEEGEEFLQRLNGWFNGIIVDARKGAVILFNDRYGMQRVYVYEGKDEFLFSSEAKSLLKIRPDLRNLDMKSLGEYLSCGCVLENRSLFQNIDLLPGGSVWTFRSGSNENKRCYFEASDFERQPVVDREAFYARLKEVFSGVLPRYFEPRDSIGLSLTGGLDTRMILAYIDSYQSFPCYTYGGAYRDCLDVGIAGKIAAVCRQKHQVIGIGKEFFDNFPNLAEKTVYVTDGCHDVGGSHDIFLNSRAREIAPIRITGKFGGEVLRGVANLKADPPCRELFDPEFYQNVLEARGTVEEISRGRPLSYSVFRGIPWRMYGCMAAEQSQIIMRSPFMDNEFVELVYQAPADVLGDNGVSLRLIADRSPNLAKIPTDRGFGGRHGYLLSRLYELGYFSLFKLDWYYGVGMPSWLMMFESYYGLVHLKRPLLGVQRIDHYRMWFQNEVSSYVREILLDRVTMGRPYLNSLYLEHMVDSHMRGRQNYTNEINRALTVELIQRLLIENI